jgi:hypothetical protein
MLFVFIAVMFILSSCHSHTAKTDNYNESWNDVKKARMICKRLNNYYGDNVVALNLAIQKIDDVMVNLFCIPGKGLVTLDDPDSNKVKYPPPFVVQRPVTPDTIDK